MSLISRISRRDVLTGAATVAAPGPALAALRGRPGQVQQIEGFGSQFVKARSLSIWLPDGYRDGEAHNVLYMHDGQNLFDPATAYGGVSWDVDRHLQALIDRGTVRPTMVVGVWNTDNRSYEYLPDILGSVPAELRSRAFTGEPQSDGYVRFLTEELKPHIDRTFKTNPGREATAIAGSSMGGLISFYALGKRPDLFGAAAALSLHAPLTVAGALLNPPDRQGIARLAGAFADWCGREMPDPGHHRLYIDHGTEGLDALYAPLHAQIVEAIIGRGYRPDGDLVARQWPGTDHNEASWSARLDAILPFVLAGAPVP